jgi:adenylate kinase family enzyme
MQKVAVFGNAGGGKSTLARRIAELTGLPHFALDILQYRSDRGKIPHEEYLAAHADLLKKDRWIIDGYGCTPSSWQRFAAADTLIYIDLPLLNHYWWVSKRLLKGAFVNPEGWPERSPLWKSTMEGYRVVGLCEKHLAPKYRQLVADCPSTKRVHHLRSPVQIGDFVNALAAEYPSQR